MSALFISDLHLEAERPDISEAFLRFMREKASGCEQLYILGDLFELWIGDDFTNNFVDSIKAAMKTLSDSGTQCFLMHGNRDFLIGKTFSEQTGFTLLSDPYVLDYQNQRYLLMHGDLLCTADTEYMQLRQLFRSPPFQQNFLEKNLEERLAIGKKMRATSSEAASYKNAGIMDVTEAEVIKYMEQYQASTLIHGHTHRPMAHEVTLEKHSGKRIVLSDWDQKVQYVEIDEQGCHLKFFN